MQIISKYKTIYRWKTGTIHIQVMWIIYGAFNIFHLKIASNSQKSQTSSLVIQLNHPSPYKHPHDRKKIQTQRHKLHFWPNSNIKLKCWGEKKKKKRNKAIDIITETDVNLAPGLGVSKCCHVNSFIIYF